MEKPSKKSRKLKPWQKAVAAVGIFACAMVVVVIAALNTSKPEKVEEPNFDITLIDEENQQQIVTPTLESQMAKEHEELEDEIYSDPGYEHFLVLGVDEFAKGYSNRRADTVMIVSYNREQKRVVFSGIPRDTYVYIEGKGYDKLNHSYAYGKAQLTMETINANFDLNIEKYVTVNFDCLVEVVDAVGGVGITLSKAESEHITTHFYTPGTEPGYNVLNGKQALAYCRTRKIDSDSKRSERDYNVMMQVFAKAKKMSPTKWVSLMTKIYDDVYTNMTLKECISLATEVLEIENLGMEHTLVVQGDDGKKINGVYYDIEKDLVGSLTAWRQYLGNNDYKPTKKVQHISDYLSGLWK